MSKSSISVGDDTPTGEPGNAPEGPYITDEDDGSRPRDRKPAKDDKKDGGSDEPTDAGEKRPPGAVRTDF